MNTDSPTPRLAFRLPLDPARLQRARERIRDYLHEQGVALETVQAVVLAIEEAMTNAVRHSGASDDLEVGLHFEGSDLVAEVVDHGKGFAVEEFDPTQRPDPMATGGRGLYLIAQLMDDLRLRRDGGLEVRAAKRGVTRRPRSPGARAESMAPGAQAHSDLRQRTMLDELPEAYAALDWEFRYLYVNESFCQITGRPPEGLLGFTLWELFPEIIGTDVEQRLHEAMNLGMPSHYEFFFPPLDSWFEQRLYPTAFGISQFSVEINERKRKELEREQLLAALRSSEERQTFLLKHAPAAIYEMDYRTARFVSVNDFMCEITGYSREELLAMDPLDLLTGDDRAVFAERIRGLLAGERNDQEVEYRVLTKQGEERFAVVNATPIFEDGEPAGAFVVALDVTERKRAEEELRETARLGEALASIDTIVHSSLSPDQIIDAALREGAWAIGAETAGLSLHDDGAQRFTVTYVYNMPDDRVGVVIPDSADTHGVRAMRTGQTQAIADTLTDPRVVRALMDEWHIRSVICAPLVVHGRPLGVAYYNYQTAAHHFSPQEVEFVTRLASSMSLAVENAQLLNDQIAARREARAELELTDTMLRAAAALTSSIDLRAVLETLADLTLQTLRLSRLFVLGYDPDADQLEVLLTRGTATLTEGSRLRIAELSPAVSEAVRRRTTARVDYDASGSPARVAALPRELRTHLALWVPIVWKDELLGFVEIDEPGERHDVSDREIELVEAICKQAAAAIANARLYEAQRHVAVTLQESLRHALPTLAGLDVGLIAAPASEPGLIGGDFWDLFELPDARVLAAIGDVAGKGVAAAGMAATVRASIRALATVEADPSFVLRKTNELLLGDGGAFATALVLIIDTTTGRVSFGSAGHPGPLHLSTSACGITDPRFGPPLGTFVSDYPVSELSLAAGDTLLLYTDGVTEARLGEELFGEDRLRRVVCDARDEPAQSLAETVRNAASEFADRLRDDLQVLAIRRR